MPLSVIALSDLPMEQRGNATGLFNLTRELGGSIGTAAMSSLLTHQMTAHYQYLTENVSIFNQITREQIVGTLGGVGWKFLDPNSGVYSILQLRINQQALVRAFNQNFSMLALVFALNLVLIFFLKRPGAGVKVEGAH